MATGLADGVPARGDPRARRLRRVRDPRPVDRRGAHRRRGSQRPSRTPAATAASRSSRVGAPARAGSSARSTGGATARTARTPSSLERRSFSEHNLQPQRPRISTPVRCEMWGGCAWINLDDDAPPLRQCIEPFATILDAWKVESLRTEWWYACRLPVNWKLAEEAFMEQYHVVETHPAARHPRAVPVAQWRSGRPPGAHRRGAPLPAHDERGHGRDGARQRRRASPRASATWSCPSDPSAGHVDLARARSTTRWCAGTGPTAADIPDLNDLEARGLNEPMGYCFPHYFVLPDVQQRLVLPLPPARARGDADGDLVAHPVPGGRRAARSRRRPRPGSTTTRAGRRSPRRTSRTCRGSRRACTRRASSTCACPSELEGGISNFERTIDGFLAGLPYEKLLPALQSVNVNPLESPIVDLGF